MFHYCMSVHISVWQICHSRNDVLVENDQEWKKLKSGIMLDLPFGILRIITVNNFRFCSSYMLLSWIFRNKFWISQWLKCTLWMAAPLEVSIAWNKTVNNTYNPVWTFSSGSLNNGFFKSLYVNIISDGKISRQSGHYRHKALEHKTSRYLKMLYNNVPTWVKILFSLQDLILHYA